MAHPLHAFYLITIISSRPASHIDRHLQRCRSNVKRDPTVSRSGVAIYRTEADGSCVVSKKVNAASPLEVGDVIVRLNSVYLPGVEGGVQGWVALFQSYSKVERDVVIRRQVPAVTAATVPATASLARAPTTNNNTMLPSWVDCLLPRRLSRIRRWHINIQRQLLSDNNSNLQLWSVRQ